MKIIYILILAVLLVSFPILIFAQGMARFSYTVINAYPHDTRSFTQGLVYEAGFFYEGTGLYGKSSLQKRTVENGRIVKTAVLPFHLFGEGIALVGDHIFQLTWKSGNVIKYTKRDFKEVERFKYKGEGWGLTFDGTYLIVSSGTDRIDFMTPDTFKRVRSIRVRQNGIPVRHLNELEYIKGEIFANIWGSDVIVKIDPQLGTVTGIIDLTGLFPQKMRKNSQDVLNGIAYDKKKDRLFVTGKRWPKIFEIALVKK